MGTATWQQQKEEWAQGANMGVLLLSQGYGHQRPQTPEPGAKERLLALARPAAPTAQATGPSGPSHVRPSAAMSQLTVVFTARYIRAPRVWVSFPRTSWSSPKRSKVTTGLNPE